MITLAQKIIVVTGGEGLLGKAIVRHCREAGATVVSADIALKRNADCTEIGLDIGDEASIKSCMDAVRAHHGRIDGLVNCAYPRTEDWRLPFEEVPAASFRQNLDLQLAGPVLCCRAALEHMKTQKSGSVVNVASIYGMVAPDFGLYEGTDIATSPAAYGAIKGGIIQMTRYLASYYGKHDLRVNTLTPGGIMDSHSSEFSKRYDKKTMLGRMATPDDIAPGAVYLLSDAASYVTGQNLVIDGGLTAW